MNPIDNVLNKLEYCIQHNKYEKIETDFFELKDNSHHDSDWKEVHKSVNAFLNKNGGVIFIGIHEDAKGKNTVLPDLIMEMKKKLK